MAKVLVSNIIDTWSTLVPGQAEKRKEFFSLFIDEFEKKGTGLECESEKMGSLLGEKKKYCAIRHGDYVCFVGAEKFGTDLHVNWNLYHPKAHVPDGIASSIWRSFTGASFNELNEAKAFASVVHDSAVVAAEKLYDQADIDKKKLNRKSSGALGPI